MPNPLKGVKPIYVEVQDYLLDLIGAPDYGPGDRIPSERTLADALGINRMTVRKAIDRLVERKVLERNGTSGTRIRSRGRSTRQPRSASPASSATPAASPAASCCISARKRRAKASRSVSNWRPATR
jgi:DNA-binding GntR family transcriptional regulator